MRQRLGCRALPLAINSALGLAIFFTASRSAWVAGKRIYRATSCGKSALDEIFLTKSVDARGRSLNNSASRFTALMPQHPGGEVKHFSAPVAQLDRVPGYELGGREFESLRAHHFICEAGCLHPVLFSRRRALLLP
jgi:hypothetical protein